MDPFQILSQTNLRSLTICKHAFKVVCDINSGTDPCPSHLVLKQVMPSFEAYNVKIKVKRIKKGAVCLKKGQGSILLEKKKVCLVHHLNYYWMTTIKTGIVNN